VNQQWYNILTTLRFKKKEIPIDCDRRGLKIFMRVQITLTVPEGKRLIAKGLATRADVKRAFTRGKVLLKGGTTVSAVCEELCGRPLRISGRVTPRGTKSSNEMDELWHCAVIENGSLRKVDGEVGQAVTTLKKGDIVILGANAFDRYGNAALMIGRALGGGPGLALCGMMSEVKKVIIAVGVEKMVPGNLNEVIKNTGRNEVDLAVGMAVGLVPVCGEIYTEIDAIKTLAKVHPQIIGKGGILGAEGATTVIIDGEKREVFKVFKILTSLKGAGESGFKESFTECKPGEKCKLHLACIYGRRKIFKFTQNDKH
jgi:hypothetical protein